MTSKNSCQKDVSEVTGLDVAGVSDAFRIEGTDLPETSAPTPTNHLPSVMTEQRCSHTAKDSSPYLESHTRMCSSKTRQEAKKEVALGSKTQRLQPRDVASSRRVGKGQVTDGERWLPGMEVPGRERTTKLGKARMKEMCST